MALHDMLSAVRQLVLDEGLPAGSAAERRDALTRRFGRLSPDEIDDLAAVPPERFGIYTDLVFSGQRATLRWAYPMSMAAIVRLSQAAGDPRSAGEIQFDLVRELHRFRPWESPSTRQLAGIFQAFINERRSDLMAAWPGLADLIDYERIELEVFYALDFAGRPIVTADLAGMSVGDLMSLPVAMPPYAQVRAYRFDMLSLARGHRDCGQLPDPLPGPRECLAACGRAGDDLMPRWVRLCDAGLAALRRLRPGVRVPLNDVATAYQEALAPEHRDDEPLAFAQFFDQFAAWAAAGVLLRPNNS